MASPVTDALFGSNFKIDRHSTVFPHPDSPTRAADDLSGFNIFLKPENEGREDPCRAIGNT